ncbi:DMT family transporter [Sphingopyxis sp. MSC1_008]|jgi:quaternary ammonium compound-resistance protein SugE|uniref:DMT family transporter n=1 Tax=Sphingopyxis sp. MSC1_008 TaxID=2909265 RepID=UPI0020BF7DC5|nr:multidrug efflux SMR transporter [Sphingopyxis sp. MSC1_008]
MTPAMGWTYLVAAGFIDIAWALSMKKADGFRNPGWSALSLILVALFVYLLTRALAVLPVGTAYAVWTGIGAAGTAVLGMILFGEAVTAARIACILVIVGGTIGLQLSA